MNSYEKTTLLFTFLTLLFAGLSSSVYAQKLPIGSKGFESLSRSIFMKEGGIQHAFSQIL